MENGQREMRKVKFLEMTGCLLYVIAFLVMGAVFLARWCNRG